MTIVRRSLFVAAIGLLVLGSASGSAAPPWGGHRGPGAAPAAAAEDLPGGAVEAELNGRVVKLPLLRTDMTAYIQGDVATVELSQTFANPHGEPMHARYMFPLPPNAAVYAMRLVTGDQLVEGEIHGKVEAQKIFTKAKEEGQQAALLQQHRPNVFTQEVANLMPGDEVRVELSYAHTVPKRDGDFHYHFPMVVGPRYLPAAKPADGEPVPLEIGKWTLPATPPVARPQEIDPTRVGLEVHLEAGTEVRWVDSPSHAIDVHDLTPRERDVRLAEGRTIDNQDFVLRYRLAGEKVSAGATTWAERGRGVVSLLVEPPELTLPEQVTPREMVFVLDCSGSMAGLPLAASKRFMRQALRTLRPDDFFRIIRFSGSARSFAQTPLPASPENLKRGLAFVDSLIGHGGTEMTTGIRAALAPEIPPGALRIIVFLTDGYVGNDADIVRLIADRRGEARLFSFGIGSAVNRYLLGEMARVGRGVARFVRADEDPEDAADRLAERLAAPVLTDVRVDWGNAPISQPTPRRLPDLFAGERLRVLARYARPGDYRVVIHGKVAGAPIELPVDIALPAENPEGDALDVLWARGQIADLMIDFLNPAGDAEVREAIRQQVTELGLKHRLVTRWTAFVAVARKVVNPGGAGDAADVAVPQVHGVPQAAYPQGTFGAAPEPAEWAAMLLLLALAAWRLRHRGPRAPRPTG